MYVSIRVCVCVCVCVQSHMPLTTTTDTCIRLPDSAFMCDFYVKHFRPFREFLSTLLTSRLASLYSLTYIFTNTQIYRCKYLVIRN